MVGAVVALAILTAGPAGAVTPANVAAGTPSWSSSMLKASASFKNAASVTAKYSYTLQLVRTTTATKPTCTTTTGCATISTGSQVLLTAVTSSISLAAFTTGAVPTLSVNCALDAKLTANRVYWSWLKVADSSGNVVASTSSSISGKYC